MPIVIEYWLFTPVTKGAYSFATRQQGIKGIIVQNGNAYDEDLGPQWNETHDYWENPTPEKLQKVAAFLSEEGTKHQYTGGLPTHFLA